mmetsp:Transcript_28187/g.61252  ORF Transcript_28187/g.61252 Transcript_28187/m.61252 type:complete len:905 (-) Transcript_28187:266-2980(-)
MLSLLWKIIPQHVPGDLNLTPITSRICNWCSLICVILAVSCHFLAEYSDLRPPVTEEDMSMPEFLRFTAALAFGGLLYELCLAICIKVMGFHDQHRDDPSFRRRLRLNRKMMFVFAFLTMTYVVMSGDHQPVHHGWIANYHGGHQIVYSVRYIEWVCCAPFVLSISGQLEHTKDGQPRNALIPSSMLTGIYCIISWQGIVVKDFYWAWGLIVFAFISYFVCCVEQIAFAWHIKDQGRAGPIRAALLFYLVIMIGIYGVVYLLPIPGWISATFENKFYCLGDASFKLGTSVMLLATNDLADNEEMRRRAEATADELERLIQTATVPIFGVDLHGRINQWNEKTAELTGLPTARAMGLPLISMLGEGSQAAGCTMIHNATLGRETDVLETTLNAAGQQVNDAHFGEDLSFKKAKLVLSAAPRKDKHGDVKGVCFVGCDLTEVSAYKEAEARKVRFMAVVSHELRSPLHGIIGLMDHLCDSEKDESRLRFMKLVKNCATRLLDLVVNIMEMASFVGSNDGNQRAKKISRDPVELAKILDEVVMLVRNATDKGGNPLLDKSVKLENEVKHLPIIEADAYKCAQVFYNIVTNACKFTSKGSIYLSSSVDPQGDWVEIHVRDTGRGISNAALERIFQPFEQEDNSALRGYQGIGLGLSIANEVVKQHGGRINVISELGVGTTFTVRLPVVMAEPSKKVEGTEAGDNESHITTLSSSLHDTLMQPEASNRRASILSVDDDAVNQEIMRGILKDFDVHFAMDGSEAIDFLRKCHHLPDIALVDVMMPGMSGFEVCKYIRQKLHIPTVVMPILMISACTQDTAIVEGLDAGATDFVLKPFDKQVLSAHIRVALRIKREHERALDGRSGIPLPTGASVSSIQDDVSEGSDKDKDNAGSSTTGTSRLRRRRSARP